MADLAIEETNRIRASLGMKPLPVPGAAGYTVAGHDTSSDSSDDDEEKASTLETRQAQGYDNWKRLRDEADAKRQREAKAEAIKKARDAAQKFAKLQGKGLGDEDGDKDAKLDTKSWLLQQKTRRKKIEKERAKAEKIERELAERESEANQYTSKDLEGVNVAHAIEDFEGEGEQILTLKDATIDENEEEGDELENTELRDREVLNKKLDLKKKKPVYDPTAEAEGRGGAILEHYDESIDGKKRKRFQLDNQTVTVAERNAMKEAVGERLKALPISLDILRDDKVVSDYNDYVQVKMKKPKKKKATSKRQKAIDEDDSIPPETGQASNSVDVPMNLEYERANGNANKKPQADAELNSFGDDEDLQASLALQRRAALKKRKRTRPEDIARQLREEDADDATAMDESQDGGLVLDETTEFVANLERTKLEENDQAAMSIARTGKPVKEETVTPDQDEMMGTDDEDDGGEPEIKQEIESADHSGTGLDEEATLDKGLGATLNMLSQRGLINARNEEDIVGLHRDRQRFLFEKQKREADIERKARLQRERDRASGKLDQMSAREREEYARYENKQRDQLESRQMTDVFNREYKPDVQLKYVDEFGRSMNQKEAFKHLSHQFHGKGSGKQKTEKHLKKIEDAKAKEGKSLLDASQDGGMNNAQGATAKKNRQAGVRLG